MHEEELDVLDVADEEGLVARGHHVAGALVGAIANLERQPWSAPEALPCRSIPPSLYLGHGSSSLEAAAHTVVDTLGLPPARVD